MNEHYDASDIQVLEGLEAVRKRPGMYIGTTDVKGLHHLVWEIVDNAIDEALAGYCNHIEVIVNKDNSVTVKDNGRGIPVDVHPKTHISTVETVYTVLHAGGKFGGGGYKVSGGLHGVGASVVNALSKWVNVTVYKNSKIYEVKFADGGKTVQKLTEVGTCEENRTGTTVTFKPDPEIFDTDIYDYETLMIRIRELAFLNRGLSLTIRDDRDEEDTTGETFMFEGGISEYVKFINQGKTVIHDDVIHLEGEEDDVFFEVAMQYNSSYKENIYSFVNNINTHDGGTHEDGVKRALTRLINNYARKTNMLKEKGLLVESEGKVRVGCGDIVAVGYRECARQRVVVDLGFCAVGVACVYLKLYAHIERRALLKPFLAREHRHVSLAWARFTGLQCFLYPEIHDLLLYPSSFTAYIRDPLLCECISAAAAVLPGRSPAIIERRKSHDILSAADRAAPKCTPRAYLFPLSGIYIISLRRQKVNDFYTIDKQPRAWYNRPVH